MRYAGRHRHTAGHRRPAPGHRYGAALLALSLALLAADSWRPGGAAFTATTANPGERVTTAEVVLTDDDGGSALFTITGMLPGDSVTRCVTVTYAGTASLSGPVRVYATGTSGGLGSYLRFTIEEGAGSTSAACAGFTPATTVYDATRPAPGAGTLAAFTAARASYASGVGAWTPAASGQSRSYRFTLELMADNGGQGATVQTTMNWTVRS